MGKYKYIYYQTTSSPLPTSPEGEELLQVLKC